MGKKVGIMTLYYKTYNYGAQLQAYALQKVVERLGYECEQISFKWYNLDTERFYTGLGGLKPASIEGFKNFSDSIPHSRRVYTPEDIRECVDGYDVFICGSDQIWGCTVSMPRYVLPQITLSYVPDDKVKFSYGASMGGAEIDTVTKTAIKYAVSKLDAVSVREQSAVPFVASMTDKPVADVLDPTLLLNTSDWDSLAVSPNRKKGYVFCYVLGDDTKVAEYTEYAKQQADSLCCEAVVLSYSIENTTSPQEFIGLIKYAKLVITNSFHGTVFSILYNKEFFACGIDDIHSAYSKNIRITDLLNKLGLQSRFVDIKTIADKMRVKPVIDYDNVNLALKSHRERSLCFLRDSLAIEKGVAYDLAPDKDCRGCGVCVSLCPDDCISMQQNRLGFLYPQIDKTKCTGCERCKDLCPALNTVPKLRNNEIPIYIAYYKNNEVRLKSSSGGLFSVFAEEILTNGGVVFGAAYASDMSVFHTFVETVEDLDNLRRSKYVQSCSGNSYKEAELFLKQDRPVLYCGVPCQIEALKVFLGKEYDNLIAIDLACGGVTAPSLWHKYIDFKGGNNIEAVNMRDRFFGYKARDGAFPSRIMGISFKTGDVEIFNGTDDLFLKASIDFYRECCYDCKIKTVNRSSDLLIGDYIGISSDDSGIDDNKGASIVLVQSERGRKLFEAVSSKLEYRSIPIETVTANRSMIISNLKPSAYQEYLHSIFAESSIEKIYYEYSLCAQSRGFEVVRRSYIHDGIRGELLGKLTKFQMLGCSLDFDHDMKGKVFIYGAGKIGKLTCDLFNEKLLGFIDGFVNFNSCKGYPVLRLESDGLKEMLKQTGEVTVLVTVPWDMDKISAGIKTLYPKITNIVSVEKSVEKIWL